MPLLEVRNLDVVLDTRHRKIYAVNNVEFQVNEGETVGLVGESGSGKSVTCRSILKLLPKGIGKMKKGEILFEGINLATLAEKEMLNIRGKRIGMISQDPMSSLDPVYRIGDQIMEVLRRHEKLSRTEAKSRAVELLRLVGIPSPEKRITQYPHELSGGMRQRVMIALAVSCNPKLLIADEPTTALDVTVQDQVLQLLQRLQKEFGMGILLVTHNLGVVAETCDRVVVLYAGKVMEQAATDALFKNPRHPYTLGLIRSVPQLDTDQELIGIPGSLPVLSEPVMGCPFQPRCSMATKECLKDEAVRLRKVADGHWTACIHHERVSVV
ncbi:ABC transporter ATP-binding protein [Ammoniphilus sp. CFH 90114]|uniref:ABC transporter ATP-binding protein n=1 Tax=Ammoniphilus sp. CFH 90114 TaxID=2493665 RepID=UPI00100DC7F9|nr:ABC transporter ATP-binding protein [Ammoniphilus sp. CFH 90114]RXT08180.1 ABC transporter ATP-binding protein [Ammoniphilus sp. CFH 90114]